MQLLLEAVPINSPKLEDTYYSQIIPGMICQSLPIVVDQCLSIFLVFSLLVCNIESPGKRI